jgi:hypothetical protein
MWQKQMNDFKVSLLSGMTGVHFNLQIFVKLLMCATEQDEKLVVVL